MAHNATHVPFRDWCPICVASRGRSSPHRRVVVNKTADTLPRAKLSHVSHSWKRAVECDQLHVRSESGYEDLTKEILRHFEAYGFLNPMIIQCEK